MRQFVICRTLDLTLADVSGHQPQGGTDALMELLMLNSRHWSKHWAGRLTLRFCNCLVWLRYLNWRWRPRHNIAHPYNLTDELFETFLHPRR